MISVDEIACLRIATQNFPILNGYSQNKLAVGESYCAYKSVDECGIETMKEITAYKTIIIG